MHPYIVVSGLPASGKTTIARQLAVSLSMPAIDKDDVLERLFRDRGIGDAQWRKSLSTAADLTFEKLSKDSNGAVLTSWWRHPQSPLESGTPTGWLKGLVGPLIEVHCSCLAETATKRFLERKRHPGHLDERWTYEDLLAIVKQQISLGPLGVGPIVEVNTDIPFNNATQIWNLVNAITRADHTSCVTPEDFK